MLEDRIRPVVTLVLLILISVSYVAAGRDPVFQTCANATGATYDLMMEKGPNLKYCCEKLHNCEDVITAGAVKFGLVNHGTKRRFHCDCDMNFGLCLRNHIGVNRVFAYRIGHTYFTSNPKPCLRKVYNTVCDKYFDNSKRGHKDNGNGEYFCPKWYSMPEWDTPFFDGYIEPNVTTTVP